MKPITLFALLVLLNGFSLYGQTAQGRIENTVPADWKTLSESGYSIQFPESYDLDQSGNYGMSFMLLSKQTSNSDLFRENINLLIQNLAGQNINLDQYVAISVDQIQTMLDDGNLIESKRLRANNMEFQKVIYTGSQNQFNLKWMQYYWVKNDRAYVLTLTCEENQFDNYVGIGEKIMNTFKIK